MSERFRYRHLALAVMLAASIGTATASEDIPSVDAEAAYERVTESDALLLDVRTRPELQFVGAPEPLDLHVPIRLIVEPLEWNNEENIWRTERNEDFASEVTAALAEMGEDKDAELVVICRSGSRSVTASQALLEAGYSDVTHVSDGFEGDKNDAGYRRVNGWLNADLPVAKSLPADRVYQP